MYDGCLRIGELCALEIEDVSFQADGSALIIVRRSKTDPQGSGRNGYLTKRTSRLLRAWIKTARIQTGPIFRPCTNTNVLDKDLHTDSVRRIIKIRARQAGVNLKRVRGHSLRRGCAQELTRRGASLQDVAEIGGWKSHRRWSSITSRENVPRRTPSHGSWKMTESPVNLRSACRRFEGPQVWHLEDGPGHGHGKPPWSNRGSPTRT